MSDPTAPPILESPESLHPISDDAASLTGEMLLEAAHDLRSPLGAIVLWSAILRETPPGGPDARNAIDMIERSARALGDRLRELADTGELLPRMTHPPPGDVDARGLIEAAAAAVGPEAGKRGVALGALSGATGAVVRADPRRLRRALELALGSLVHDAPRGATLALGLEARDGMAIGAFELVVPAPAAVGPGLSRSSQLRARLACRLVEIQGGRLSLHGGAGMAWTLEMPLARPEPAP